MSFSIVMEVGFPKVLSVFSKVPTEFSKVLRENSKVLSVFFRRRPLLLRLPAVLPVGVGEGNKRRLPALCVAGSLCSVVADVPLGRVRRYLIS